MSKNWSVAALPPFQVGLQQRRGARQQALHRSKASALNTQQVSRFCQYESNTDDTDVGYLLTCDSVSFDNVCNNVSCLHASTPMFHPMGFDQVVPNQFNDRAFVCSCGTWGFLSRPDRDGHWLTVWHLLSFEGSQCSLADCPNSELVQFVLEGILDGVQLGSVEGTIDADPWHCKNGCVVQGCEAEL